MNDPLHRVNYRNKNREKFREAGRRYYWAHRERILEKAKTRNYSKAYEERHREKRKASKHLAYLKNKDEISKRGKLWRENNKPRIREGRRKRWRKDPDKFRKKCRDSYWRNVEKRRISSRKYSWGKSRRRLARIRGGVIDERGIKQWIEKVRSSPGGICYYCKVFTPVSMIEFDHIIPISRSGPHSVSNLCVSCLPCNRSKHMKTPGEWPETGQKLFNF